jgi:hypothetical protein
LPFQTEEERGFVLPDLRGPGGWFGQVYGYPYLMAYRATLEYHRGQTTPEYRLDVLVPMRDNDLLREARRMITPALKNDQRVPLMSAWRDALQFARARPVLGFGAGAMQDMLEEKPRSLVLEILVSFGVLGILAFLTLLVILLHRLVNRKSLESITLLAIFAVILLMSATQNLIAEMPITGLVAVLLGLAFSAIFHPDSEPYEHWIEHAMATGYDRFRR